jgi:hypothetical protein
MKRKSSISGIGNKPNHQYIISDLIFAIRKKMQARKLGTVFGVLSEITLSEIGYETTSYHFTRNHNIDLVVVEKESGDIIFLAEIERANTTITATKMKIKECLKTIPSIEEAFIISFTLRGDTLFERCTLENNQLIITPSSSYSNTLGMTLKSALVSLR